MKINVLRRFYIALFLLVSLLHANSQQVLSLKEPKIKSTDVEQLQKVLLYYGYDPGKQGVDGVFGQATEKALKDYQKSLGKEPTGIIAVTDIPVELLWSPKINGPVKDKVSPVSNPKNSNITTGKKLSTKFGSWVIPSENELGERYYDFKLSPSERFITAYFYSPDGDQTLGIPFYCVDLLTGKKELYYGLQITGHNSDKDQTRIAEGKLSILINDIYWTADERLFISIESFDSGKSVHDGYYLVVKP
jgi:peptidoglycan hydrolase-like protein with peptidoglycan-binding domain